MRNLRVLACLSLVASSFFMDALITARAQALAGWRQPQPHSLKPGLAQSGQPRSPRLDRTTTTLSTATQGSTCWAGLKPGLGSAASGPAASVGTSRQP